MNYLRITKGLFICLLGILFTRCTPSPSETAANDEYAMPVARTYADSIAMGAIKALGGLERFEKLPVLQFNFGFERGDERTVRNRHLWNKHSGDYRIEYATGVDSSYVILFNVHTREGAGYLNGKPLASEDEKKSIERAYSSFINDVYWLHAPMKMMDPGVSRTYLPDSSDATTDVIKLTFEGVGLTPGDQYWMYVDKASKQLKQWSYILQGNPDAEPRVVAWGDYIALETAAGPLTFATRKHFLGGDFSIITDNIKVFNEAPEGMMTNVDRMLD